MGAGQTQTPPGPRSTLYYRSRKPEQTPLRHRIKEIAAIRVRYGYRRIHTPNLIQYFASVFRLKDLQLWPAVLQGIDNFNNWVRLV